MEYGNLLGNSLKTVMSNFVAYGVATIVLTIGSMLVITAPPLLYGFIIMLVRGSRQEMVKCMDILDGFRFGNFVRSWKYMLFVMIIGVLVAIVAMILLFIVGLLSFGFIVAAGSFLPESVSIAIAAILYLVVICIVLIPFFFMLYLLPLYVIKGYDVTDAFSESTRIVKANIMTSVIISLIVGVLSLMGSLPYYVGLFMEWPFVLNMLIYTLAVLITMPFSQQILVNTTLELGSFPEHIDESDV
ncbi:hypothetical protein [Methanolobus bombayensis]|uniref:hypothetical protein n=1 Tax=Methanolobus bombayensis TaxID=38023 RepID=UPI001AE21524|nr:hypothetical protein [Methanolobus bombayensis]MBP1908463.1 hypothetical protein [Methanolobus bombayensis]